MSNGGTSIAQLILEQIRDFKTEVRDDVKDIKESISDVKSDVGGLKEDVGDVKEDVGNVKVQLTGCNQRISALETQMSRFADSPPGSVSVVPVVHKAKGMKDHLPTAGIAAAVLALTEVINAVIKALGK